MFNVLFFLPYLYIFLIRQPSPDSSIDLYLNSHSLYTSQILANLVFCKVESVLTLSRAQPTDVCKRVKF